MDFDNLVVAYLLGHFVYPIMMTYRRTLAYKVLSE